MPLMLIPLLGQILDQTGILDPDSIIKYIGLAVSAVTHLNGADDRLTKLKAHMEQIVAEGREPRQDEWDAISDQMTSDLDRIAKA